MFVILQSKSECDSQRKLVGQLTQERDSAQLKVGSLEKQIKALDDDRSSTHARLQKQLMTLESAVRGARDKFESQRAALQQRAETAEADAARAVETSAAAMEAAAQREDALRSEVKQLRAALEAARASHRKATADATDERIEQLRCQLSDAKAAAAAEQRSVVSGLTQAVQQKSHALAEADEECRRYRRQVGALQLAHVLGSTLQHAQLRDMRGAFEHMAAVCALSRSDIRQQLDSAGTREAQLQRQLVSQRTQINDANSAADDARKALKVAQRDAASLQKQLLDVQAEHTTELSRLRAQLDSAGETASAQAAEVSRLRAQLDSAGETASAQAAEVSRLRAQLDSAGAPTGGTPGELLPLMAKSHTLQARLHAEARATAGLTLSFDEVRESLDAESGRSAAMEAMLLMLKLHMTGQQQVTREQGKDGGDDASPEGPLVMFQDPPEIAQAASDILSSTFGAAESGKVFDMFISSFGAAARKHLVAHTERERRKSGAPQTGLVPPPDSVNDSGRRLSRSNSAAGPEAERVATAAGVPRRRKSVVSSATPGISSAARTLASLACAGGRPLEGLAHTSLSKALQATASQLQAERTLNTLLSERVLHLRARTAAVRSRVAKLVPGTAHVPGSQAAAATVASSAIAAATTAVSALSTATAGSSSTITTAVSAAPTSPADMATSAAAASSASSTTTMSSGSGSDSDSSDTEDTESAHRSASSPAHEALSPQVLQELTALEECVAAALAHTYGAPQALASDTASQDASGTVAALAEAQGELSALLSTAALSDAARTEALQCTRQAQEAMQAASLAVQEMESTKEAFQQAQEQQAAAVDTARQQWSQLFQTLCKGGSLHDAPRFEGNAGHLQSESLQDVIECISTMRRGGLITPPSSPGTPPPESASSPKHALPPGTPQRIAAALSEASQAAEEEPFQGPAHAVAQFACIAHALTTLSDAMHSYARKVFEAPDVPSEAAARALAGLPDTPTDGACGMCTDAVRFIYNASAHVVEALAEAQHHQETKDDEGGAGSTEASPEPRNSNDDAPALARLNALLAAAGSALGVARADMGGAKDEVARRAEETANLRSQIEYLDMRDMRQGAVRAQLEARLAEAHARVRALGAITGGLVRLLAPALIPEEQLTALWSAALAEKEAETAATGDRLAARGGPPVTPPPDTISGIKSQLPPRVPPVLPSAAQKRLHTALQDAGVSPTALVSMLTDALQPPLPSDVSEQDAKARMRAQTTAGTGHAGGMSASAAAARQALIAFLRQVARDDERDAADSSSGVVALLQVRAAELAEAAAAAQGAAASAAARAEELERDLTYSRSEVVRLSEEVFDKVQEVNAVHDQLRCVEDDLAVRSADAVMLRLQLQMAEGASAAEVAAAAAAAVETEVHGAPLPPTPATPGPLRTPMRGGSLDDTPRKVSWRGALTDERTIEARLQDDEADSPPVDADFGASSEHANTNGAPPRAPLPPPLSPFDDEPASADKEDFVPPPPLDEDAPPLDEDAPPLDEDAPSIPNSSLSLSLRDIAERPDDIAGHTSASGSPEDRTSPPLQWHSPEHPPRRGLERQGVPTSLSPQEGAMGSQPGAATRRTPPRPTRSATLPPSTSSASSGVSRGNSAGAASASPPPTSSQGGRRISNGSDDVGSPRSPPSPEPMGGLSSPTATAMVRAKRKPGKGGSSRAPGTEGGKLLWDMLAGDEENSSTAPTGSRYQARARPSRDPPQDPPRAEGGALQQQLASGSHPNAAASHAAAQRSPPSQASLEAALAALGLDGQTEAAVRVHLEGMRGGGGGTNARASAGDSPSSERPSWR